MTKWTIIVIVFVAWNLDCTYKQPLAGKSRNGICKNSAMPPCSCSLQKNRVCRESPATPLFSLLPLYSCASGSLTSTSAIHSSFNGYSSNCMFAGAVTSLSCLPFLQPMWAICHVCWQMTGSEWVSLWIVCTLKIGKFITIKNISARFIVHQPGANNSTTVLTSGRNTYKLYSSHWAVECQRHEGDSLCH